MNTIKQKDIESKKSKVFISFVLDESGSMQTGRKEIISGMNEQIQSIKNKFSGTIVEPVVSFVKFADNVISLYEGKTMDDLKEFELMGYVPNGSTALYDAVGYTIDMVSKFDGINEEGNSSILVIVTDGDENASKRYNSSQIAEKVQTLSKTGRWTVTYLGPNNVDLTKVKQGINTSYGNMLRADLTSSVGYKGAFKSIGASMDSFYGAVATNAVSGASFSSSNFYANENNSSTEPLLTLLSNEDLNMPTVSGIYKTNPLITPLAKRPSFKVGNPDIDPQQIIGT